MNPKDNNNHQQPTVAALSYDCYHCFHRMDCSSRRNIEPFLELSVAWEDDSKVRNQHILSANNSLIALSFKIKQFTKQTRKQHFLVQNTE
eukprot:scaffold998_cov162-Ochromonas_danica.AAC.13